MFGFSSDSLTQTIGYNVLPQNPQFLNEDTWDTSNLPSSYSQNSVIATAAQLFVDPAGDFHLRTGSPAIDAGTSSGTHRGQRRRPASDG